MPLTGKQSRHLRALGHHLEPIVQLGKGGLTESIQKAVDIALRDHELVKLRIGTECPDDRHVIAETLGKALFAEVAQVLGRTVLLFRRHAKKPVILFPGEEPPPPPKVAKKRPRKPSSLKARKRATRDEGAPTGPGAAASPRAPGRPLRRGR